MKALVMGLLFCGIVNALIPKHFNVITQFENFVKKYNKTYLTVEHYNERLQVFAKNILDIELHNTQKKKTWTKGINEFSDFTGT